MCIRDLTNLTTGVDGIIRCSQSRGFGTCGILFYKSRMKATCYTRTDSQPISYSPMH